MTEAELAALIAEGDAFLAEPQSATVDGRSGTNRSMSDWIKYQEWKAAQSASVQGHFGLRFTQLIPPGCG